MRDRPTFILMNGYWRGKLVSISWHVKAGRLWKVAFSTLEGKFIQVDDAMPPSWARACALFNKHAEAIDGKARPAGE